YQYAVNIADCQDEKSDITEGPVSFTTNTTLFTAGEKTYIGLEDINGLERDTLCISKLGYVEVNIASPAPTDPPNGKYFAVELFNPDDTTEKSAVDMRDYKICIIRGYDLIGLYSLDDFLPLGAINASTGTGTGDVGVYVITESDASVGEARSALGATAVAGVLNNSVVNFLDGDKVVILKYSSIIMPVDYITIPPATISWATFNVSKVKSRRHVLSGTRFLLPASKNGSYSPWTGASAIELGQDVDPADLEIPTLAGLNKVHLTQSGRPVRNVAEIENIPAVGYSYEYGFVAGQPPKRICQTLMKGIVDSCETIKTADPSADREFGVEMGSFGKVRLDYQDYHKLTRYLSYFDISTDGVDNDGINDIDGPREVSIAGRININTAPWFVLVQLPWMTYQTSSDPLVTDVLDRVEAVIDYRDGASGPYKKIVDLLKIDQMKSLANDADNNLNSDSPIKGPDFTDDGVVDDFEELHVIFHRISNLVTVRSDMFTAYILVRLGVDGPQKRMIAIFDRSGVFSRDDRVKLVALHPIPDPR
ncbi:MAG: hypothetical protein JW912_06050, partial [Sedimentisphaerales bacterium]|nr:hypothetical protein [Sedimentisphaerales bacterium]